MPRKSRFLISMMVVALQLILLDFTELVLAQDAGRMEALRLQIVTDRSKLFSGRVKGRGWESLESPLKGRQYGPIETTLSSTFDDVRRSFLTQRTMPYFDPLSLAWVNTEYANLQTLDTTVAYTQKGGVVIRMDPHVNATTKHVGIGSAIDPRMIGVCMAARIFSGDQFSSNLAMNNLSSKGNAELVAAPDDVVIELRLTTEHSKRSFFIDTEHGYTIVRIQRSSRYADVDGNAWSPFNEEHQIVWGQLEGLWVPQTYELTERQEVLSNKERIPTNPGEREYEVHALHWELEWSDINREMTDLDFSESAIDVPKGTYLLDEQHSKSEAMAFPHPNNERDEAAFRSGLIGASDSSGPAIPPALSKVASPKVDGNKDSDVVNNGSSRVISAVAILGFLSILGYTILRSGKKAQ